MVGALCLGGLSHLSIEVGQVFIASRVSDINDVLSGLLGTASGAAAFALVCGTQGEAGQGGLVSRPICLWLVAFNLGLMGFSALKPFVFSFDPGFLAKGLSSVNLVPLLPYFHKTDFGALEDLGKRPDLEGGFLLMGNVYLKGKDLESARGCFESAMKLAQGSKLKAPIKQGAPPRLGRIRGLRGLTWPWALCTPTGEMDRRSVEAWIALGNFYRLVDRWEEAERASIWRREGCGLPGWTSTSSWGTFSPSRGRERRGSGITWRPSG